MTEIGMFQPASKGRIVMVTVIEGEATVDLPAVITYIHNPDKGTFVNVLAFGPNGTLRPVTSVYYRDHPSASKSYNWHWPEYAPSISLTDAGLA